MNDLIKKGLEISQEKFDYAIEKQNEIISSVENFKNNDIGISLSTAGTA